jgi:hypothetical protein
LSNYDTRNITLAYYVHEVNMVWLNIIGENTKLNLRKQVHSKREENGKFATKHIFVVS